MWVAWLGLLVGCNFVNVRREGNTIVVPYNHNMGKVLYRTRKVYKLPENVQRDKEMKEAVVLFQTCSDALAYLKEFVEEMVGGIVLAF
ncbi:hypothetical protein BDY21DRAFT_331629 [Lineolata rhizophorae]|uniref:Uncharacterized protein n=1 Tax=Lineolata rhizophorae TaxID=578093 RepID=A0A6A6PBC3_9PEZI|nr:hypothetical protein BDY21DRAFT_331629 [Lineolata rhizophorae]